MIDPELEETPEKVAENESQFQRVLDEALEIPVDSPDVSGEDPAAPASATDAATTEPPAPVSSPAPDESANPATPAEEGAPSVEPPAVESPAQTDAPPPFTFKVDGKEVSITGSREDGENIVIPKASWHTEVKNHLADRASIQRERQESQHRTAQIQQQKGQAEQTAQTMLTELDKIMSASEADSFDQWEKFREGYEKRKIDAERDHWKTQATTVQESVNVEAYNREMTEQFLPALDRTIRRFADEVVQDAVGNKKLPMDEGRRKQFTERMYTLIKDDADHGLIFTKTGRQYENSLMPEVVPNMERIHAIAQREIDLYRSFAEERNALQKQTTAVEAAAKTNAEAERVRKGGTPAPPAIGTKIASGDAPKVKAATTWEELEAEAANL